MTVSFIFELALLTAEYKNDPKFFAPCVTFVVTVNRNRNKHLDGNPNGEKFKWKISCIVRNECVYDGICELCTFQSINPYDIHVDGAFQSTSFNCIEFYRFVNKIHESKSQRNCMNSNTQFNQSSPNQVISYRFTLQIQNLMKLN